MARRTIHARRASPYQLYLMIAFIVIAVTGWTLWGWTFSNLSALQQNAVGESRLNQAASSGRDAMKDLLNQYKDDLAKLGTDVTLAGLLDSKTKQSEAYETEIQRLTLSLVGSDFKGQRGDELRRSVSGAVDETSQVLNDAKGAVEKSYVDVQDQPTSVEMGSMKDAVGVLERRVGELVARVGQVETAKVGVETELKSSREQIAAIQQAHEQMMAQKDADFAKERATLESSRDVAVAGQEKLDGQLQKTHDDYIRELKTAKKTIEELRQKIVEKDNLVQDFKTKLDAFAKLPTESAVDGHVISVAGSGNVAYGDLGKDDGILMGMTFSIFSPSELGKDEAKPKASARIVKVLDHSCEMSLTPEKGADPVVTNDLLHNPVYDRGRRLHFVLVGQMDIDGDAADDTEALKAMIQKFGGKLDTSVGLQTDFLVAGEEPHLMAQPTADASPEERQAYEVNRQAFLDYKAALAQANDYRIPILKLGRFLSLAGLNGAND